MNLACVGGVSVPGSIQQALALERKASSDDV